ncbi:hypothetical protein RCL1_006613 [Eukaryota sp. TZLM3-RCL]
MRSCAFTSSALKFRDIILYTTSLAVIAGRTSQCTQIKQLLMALFIPFREIDLCLYPEQIPTVRALFQSDKVDYLPLLVADNEIIGDAHDVQELIDSGRLLGRLTTK